MKKVVSTTTPKPLTVLEEAASIINGDRHEDYGYAQIEFIRVARLWSVIIGLDVKPEYVPLCMIALKMCRERFKHKRDNLVDICGYAALANNMQEEIQ